MSSKNLCEGLIKVPAKLLYDVQHFVLDAYFTYLEYHVPKMLRFEDEDVLDSCLRMIEQEKKARGVKTLPTFHTRLKLGARHVLKVFKLDDQLYAHDVKLTVRVKVHFEKSSTLGSNLGQYNDSGEASSFIHVSPYALHMTGRSVTNKHQLKHVLAKLEDLLALVEHELTHLVQYRGLDHPSQRAGNYADEEDFSDKYAMSQVEFDPLIKSAMGTARRALRTFRRDNPNRSDREYLDSFVSAAEAIPGYGQSSFFAILKKRKPTAWKKAVKLFMSGMLPT